MKSGPGFLLRLEGPRVTTRRHDPRSGYGQEIALDLDASVVRDLALVLADLDPAGMPVNLWAPATPRSPSRCSIIGNRFRPGDSPGSSRPLTETYRRTSRPWFKPCAACRIRSPPKGRRGPIEEGALIFGASAGRTSLRPGLLSPASGRSHMTHETTLISVERNAPGQIQRT